MVTQPTRLDFTGQDIYVGMDTDKKNWDVCILTKEFEHKVFHQNPEPKILVNYLHRNFPGANYHSVYEAGYSGFWIHDALQEQGIDNIVVNPADVPTKDKERKRKNNRVDCRKLAKLLRSGVLEPIYVPTRAALEDRSLLRTRRNAVKQQTRYKNQIKALLGFYGIEIPEQFKEGNWSGHFIRWLEEIVMERPAGEEALQFHVEELKRCRQRIAYLNRRIRELAQTDLYRERVAYLTSIPGVGVITAMILLTELVDINRFRTLDHIASYVGLIPGEDSTGEDENITGIIPRRNGYLRAILIEVAWVAVRKDPALMMYYKQLTRRMCAQKAIIRVARKLLNRIRYVLKNKQYYVSAVVE